MQLQRNLWRATAQRGAVGLAICALLTAPLTASATKFYVYEDARGSRLITDHPRMDSGRLVKTYSYGKTMRATPSYSVANLRARASLYDDLIQRTAQSYGVDYALVKAVVHAESSFNPAAVSRKGAHGLMQLMPATAERYGVLDLIDPEANVTGGVRYLRDLLEMFDQDTRLAVAAYNAGENAVLRYSDVPPFNETQHFVRKVLRLHDLYAQN